MDRYGDRRRVMVNTNDEARAFLDEWMEAAEGTDPPVATVTRLFSGADAIEVSAAEAELIRVWAETLPGWAAAPADDKPLLFEAGTLDIIPAER